MDPKDPRAVRAAAVDEVARKLSARCREVRRLSGMHIPPEVNLATTQQPELLSPAGAPTLRVLCAILGFEPGAQLDAKQVWERSGEPRQQTVTDN